MIYESTNTQHFARNATALGPGLAQAKIYEVLNSLQIEPPKFTFTAKYNINQSVGLSASLISPV